jgi:hypothetical protein
MKKTAAKKTKLVAPVKRAAPVKRRMKMTETATKDTPKAETAAPAPKAPPKASTRAAGVPEGEPTETAEVQWNVSQSDTDIPLKRRPWTVDVGATFLIDQEYMTVSDVSNIDNPGVTRTTPVPHQQGAIVTIWGTARDPIGKTIAEIKTFNHGSVLVIDIVGTDGYDYLLKVSHGMLEVGGTPFWDTGKAY